MRDTLGRMFAPRPLVVIGHSHAEMVASAAAAARVTLDVLNFWNLPSPFITLDGRQHLSPGVRKRLVAPVFSMVGGAVHQDIGLVVHPRPFDFIWPHQPGLPVTPGAEIIPFDAVHASMFGRTQPYLDIMSSVRDAVDGPMFHMESPPTYDREELPQNDPGFFHFFGLDAVFSPPWFRYKLWRAHSHIVAEHCRRNGITFIAHPAASVTEDGFLKESLHGSPAHANAAYGALVLAQMLREAGRPSPV